MQMHWKNHPWYISIAGALAFGLQPCPALELTIAAGGRDRPAGPLCWKSAPALQPEAGYALVPPGGDSVPAQLDAQGRLWWWSPGMKAGESVRYTLNPTSAPPGSQGVQVEKMGEGLIEVRIDGEPFTSFHYAADDPKPYLYPVIGPTGHPVTRDYPMKNTDLEKNAKTTRQDHHHHRSLWTAHGDVRTHDFEKTGSNYWNDALQKGDAPQRVKRIVRTVSGPVFGQIEAEIDWIDNKGRREFGETRTYTFWRANPSCRMIDPRIVFHFDTSDVMFADTKEGGIVSMRLAVTMDEVGAGGQKGQMCNANGQVGEKECWGKPADWCDYVGPVNGETLGVAIFDAPGNFRHPTPWHIRGYGLYAANPFGLAEFTGDKGNNGSKLWKKGESVEFNYRIVIHRDDTKRARIADQYALYAEPPAVTMK